MPVDDRSNRARLKLPLAGSRVTESDPSPEERPSSAGKRCPEFEPLAHVLCALLISGASILLALWTFSAGRKAPFAHAAVHAAEPVGNPVAHRTFVRTGILPIQSPRRADSWLPADASEQDAAHSPEQIALHGRVVDGFRRPVPFATVWLDRAPWQRWVESDARGEFSAALPQQVADELHAQGGSVRLAARAPRYAPSQVVEVQSNSTDSLCFTLEEGAAHLRLEVTDHTGRPLAGVEVKMTPAPGNLRLARVGASQQEWMPTPVMVTDAWGLLRMDGLAPGEQELRISKPGYSPRIGRVNLVKGEICSRVLELRESSQVQGVLLRADGGPTGLATIRATSLVTLESFEVRADDEGRFHLTDLPAGPLTLVAQSRNGSVDLFEAHAERAPAAGQTELWNPVLRPVQLVRGQLLDSRCRPLAGWRVEVRDRDLPDRKPVSTETDENGSYELPAPRLTDVPVLTFFHPSAGRGFPTRVEPLDLRDEEVDDLVLEPDEELVARIVGRVLLPSGMPAGGESLVLQRNEDHTLVALVIDQAGYFTSPPVPPGLCVPIFPDHGLGWTPDEPLRVEHGESVDLGTITLPTLGRLTLMTSSSERFTQKFTMALDLLRPGIEQGFRLPVLQEILEVPLEIALAPGAYELGFPGEGVESIQFEIQSGADTLAHLTPPR